MLEFNEEIDEDRKIIVARVSGDLIVKDLIPNSRKTRMKAQKYNYGILFDFRKTKNLVTIIEAHGWFEDHFDAEDRELKYIPTAHLINKENEEFFSFVETSWCNRGIPVHMFTEEAAALEWLDEKCS